ncbi:MAG: ATP-binding cassette domain-containing protein [Ruminococcaceae bacterium]|nr:ATP-binding cassette domain-containing protein [Oscillospiraceae bacterium]
MSLSVKNLRKVFGEKTAVDDLSFEMNKSGVFGLIGTNGAGKTTTIRMILGILTPDNGSAVWNGNMITRETLSFGYMPEERGLYMKNTVIDQLCYFGMLRGMTKSNAKGAAEKLLDRLGVMEYKNMNAEKLSKGNQQKIQLIATLIHDPLLIFLDEPFSGLDPINAEMLRELIDELIKSGKYIVMSSHQMNTVEEYCENLIILHHGKTMLNGNLRDIKRSYGHTNLTLKTASDNISEESVIAKAKDFGIELIDTSADEIHFKIGGDRQANDFLKVLVASDIFPVKYEIREPSLNEIFIEKVGGNIQ